MSSEEIDQNVQRVVEQHKQQNCRLCVSQQYYHTNKVNQAPVQKSFWDWIKSPFTVCQGSDLISNKASSEEEEMKARKRGNIASVTYVDLANDDVRYEETKEFMKNWETQTLKVKVVFHLYCKIPGVDEKNLKEYFDFLLKRCNDDFNNDCPEWDNADFNKDVLFSKTQNPTHYKENRDTYFRHIKRARGANIYFELDFDHCEYKPDWNGFNTASAQDKSILSNCCHNKFRQTVDRCVKWTDGKSNAYSPDTTWNCWIVDFLDGSLCGYSTFPDDAEAGGPNDGVVLAGKVNRLKSDEMFHITSLWKTLAHEFGHGFGLRHVFQQDMYGRGANGTEDIPAQDQHDGDMYQVKEWPTNPYTKQKHVISSLMGYNADKNLMFFTENQIKIMRSVLQNPKSKRYNMCYKSVCNPPFRLQRKPIKQITNIQRKTPKSKKHRKK